MSNELLHLSAHELDTIGEVMNISMGSAATAVSSMLDRQVNITTPKIEQATLRSIDCSKLEPAIMVKIQYVEGIDGTNMIVLHRRDMQVILNLLMGNEDDLNSDDFEFDEMSMSAACEVMNQMMGASATALSEVLGKVVNISTPESMLVENLEEAYSTFSGTGLDEEIVAISFELEIDEILKTTFTSFLPLDMSKKIVTQLMHDIDDTKAQESSEAVPQADFEQPQEPAVQPQAIPQPEKQAEMQAPISNVPVQQPVVQQQAIQQEPVSQPQVQPMMQQPMGGMGQADMMQQQPMMQQYPQQMYPQMPWNGYMQPQPNMYPGYPMYPQGNPMMPNMQNAPQAEVAQAVNVKKAEFPAFSSAAGGNVPLADSNLNLLMNIPLEVSVVIGKTKRKIKDIINWGQGAVVELEKQTGAPAEIIVNGKLLAYGDVVVIDDNFGIRVTEIVGTEELLESLTKNQS